MTGPAPVPGPRQAPTGPDVYVVIRGRLTRDPGSAAATVSYGTDGTQHVTVDTSEPGVFVIEREAARALTLCT